MTNQIHEEDWAIYLTTVSENQIASILVDLGFNFVAPINSFNNLLTLTTYFNQQTEDGLPVEAESEIINEIEDNFIEQLTREKNTIYVGRIKFDGKMHSYFYVNQLDKVKVSEIASKHSSYKFDHKIKGENNWETYFDILYPSPIEMQIIQNNRVIENLEENGDNLEKERQVDHWIYFKTENDRENFIESVKVENFKVIEKNVDSSNDFPFSVQISRTDKVDFENVNEYVINLWEGAQEFNGDYDGWETFIIKD